MREIHYQFYDKDGGEHFKHSPVYKMNVNRADDLGPSFTGTAFSLFDEPNVKSITITYDDDSSVIFSAVAL